MASQNNERFKNSTDKELIEVIENNIMSVNNLAGLYYPAERVAGGYYTEWEVPQSGIPVPPTHLRHYYGVKDGKFVDELYLNTGKADSRNLRKMAEKDGFVIAGNRILEFGCSAGRVIRHFAEETKHAEVWGVDLHAEAIQWAQPNLKDFNFAVTTTAPHLPFEDNYFGFIYATSVFTHIGELDDAWLLELRRVTRPGGRILLTISDDNTLDVIRKTSPDHASNVHVDDFNNATGVLDKPYLQFVTRSTPWLQRVIYNRARWIEKTSKWLKPVDDAINVSGWQSAVLFEKREN